VVNLGEPTKYFFRRSSSSTGGINKEEGGGHEEAETRKMVIPFYKVPPRDNYFTRKKCVFMEFNGGLLGFNWI
jgi:hypothetical protein